MSFLYYLVNFVHSSFHIGGYFMPISCIGILYVLMVSAQCDISDTYYGHISYVCIARLRDLIRAGRINKDQYQVERGVPDFLQIACMDSDPTDCPAVRGFVAQKDQNCSEAVYVVPAMQQLLCLVRSGVPPARPNVLAVDSRRCHAVTSI